TRQGATVGLGGSDQTFFFALRLKKLIHGVGLKSGLLDHGRRGIDYGPPGPVAVTTLYKVEDLHGGTARRYGFFGPGRTARDPFGERVPRLLGEDPLGWHLKIDVVIGDREL